MSAVVRPRRAWEAIDLGFRMVRRHYFVMLQSSLAIVVPLFFLCQFLFALSPMWAGIALWWSKPIWERVHLHILSRALFGEAPTAKEALRAFPEYGFKQALAWLTIRRFSPTRSLSMPVTILEHLGGEERSRRLGDLSRGDTTMAATWLTIIGAHAEIFLVLAVGTLVQFLIPETFDVDLIGYMFTEESYWADRFSDGVSAAVAVLVAPFYVGGGFALYINRRTVLEGWDIEIAFRRLAERIESRSLNPQADRSSTSVQGRRVSGSAKGLATVLLVSGLVLVPQSRAMDIESGPTTEAARAAVEETLARDEFHNFEVLDLPRVVPRSGEDAGNFVKWLAEWLAGFVEEDKQETSLLPEWLRNRVEDFFRVISRGIEFFILLAVLFGVSILLLRRGTFTRLAHRRDQRAKAQPLQSLMGLEIGRQSLPEDVAATALALLRRPGGEEGNERAALGLLYRASLASLASRHSVQFRRGDTEHDCLKAIFGKLDGTREAFFRDLTGHWEALAYAHHIPDRRDIESLCIAWPQFFETPLETSVDNDGSPDELAAPNVHHVE
jgi:hypothetical protein